MKAKVIHSARRAQGKGGLIRGRSNASILLLAGRNVHFFVWAPWLGTDSAGFTLRWRRGEVWTHARLILGQRNKGRPGNHQAELRSPSPRRVLARPTLTLAEWSVWQTTPNTSKRIGTKGYVRLKAAWPGRQA